MEVWKVKEGIKVDKVNPPKDEDDEEEEEEKAIEVKEKKIEKEAFLVRWSASRDRQNDDRGEVFVIERSTVSVRIEPSGPKNK
jgi:hypothetical protein